MDCWSARAAPDALSDFPMPASSVLDVPSDQIHGVAERR